MRLLFFLSLICIYFTNTSSGRRHTLTLIDDPWTGVLCSQFAYGPQGSLAVELTNLPKDFRGDVGFSLEKSSSNDAGTLAKLRGCWLDKATDKRVLTLSLMKKWAELKYLSDKSILVLSSNIENSGFFQFVDEADEKTLKSFEPRITQFLIDYGDVSEADADDFSSEVLKVVTSDETLRAEIVSMIKQSVSEEVAVFETFNRLLPPKDVVNEDDEEEDVEAPELVRAKRALLPEPDVGDKQGQAPPKLKLIQNESPEDAAKRPPGLLGGKSPDGLDAHAEVAGQEEEIADADLANRANPMGQDGKAVVESKQAVGVEGEGAKPNLEAPKIAADKGQKLAAGAEANDGKDAEEPAAALPADGKKEEGGEEAKDAKPPKEVPPAAADGKEKPPAESKYGKPAKEVPPAAADEKNEQGIARDGKPADEKEKPAAESKYGKPAKEVPPAAADEKKEEEEGVAEGKDKKSANAAAGEGGKSPEKAAPQDEAEKPPKEEEVLPPPPPKPQLSQSAVYAISIAREAFVAQQQENHFRYVIRNGRVALNFTVTFTSASVAGAYDLIFHNCHKQKVSATIHMVERNGDNFLSLGEQPLAALFFVFAIIYAILSTVWGLHLRCTKAPVFRIHHLMLAVVIVKSISLLLHAINYYVIGQHGVQEEGWAVMYYIAHMTRGFLLFFTILMIGAGWNFIKHVFSRREKQVFLIVIPLQVFANVATIVISESEQGTRRFALWQEIFIIVDLACCVGVLVPVVWSLRHLRVAATSDGKAAAALRQLRLFRHFYVLVVAYLYATRILLYLLRLAIPLRLVWTLQLFEQAITLAFFICVGVKFRPFDANPYLQLPVSPNAEEEEVVMQRFGVEHAWSQSGMAEDVTRIHRPQGLDAARENRRRRDDALNRPLPGDEPDAADSDLMPLIRP